MWLLSITGIILVIAVWVNSNKIKNSTDSRTDKNIRHAIDGNMLTGALVLLIGAAIIYVQD